MLTWAVEMKVCKEDWEEVAGGLARKLKKENQERSRVRKAKEGKNSCCCKHKNGKD